MDIMASLLSGLTAIVTLGLASSSTASAAEIFLPERVAQANAVPDCRCPINRTFVYHRELRATYGTGFDPRNYDEAEPHFYFGPVRRYARYWGD
jgi:hypothetical protein